MPALFDAAVRVAYHAVTGLAHVLAPALGAVAPAAAIVAVTIALRLALLPLSYSAMRGQAASARLAPRVADLRRRYARQPERLQRELAALYRAEGGGLLAAIGPALVQLPFFSVLYRLFLSASVAGRPNLLLTRSLLGAPLGARLLHLAWPPLPAAGLFPGQILVIAALAGLIAVAGWLSGRLARRLASPGTPPAGGLLRLLPYSTAVLALFVPLAADVYLLATAWWTLAERRVLLRRAQAAAGKDATGKGTGSRPRPATPASGSGSAPPSISS
jgi:YidC/Oxa1 family membrane protein insertase